MENYPFEINALSDEEGGGYLITFPDLPGCMSDGESVAEAVENGQDAVKAWLITAKETNRPIPAPGSVATASGQFRLRVPKSLHARLVRRADREGVSMNTLAVALLAEGMGRAGRPAQKRRKTA